jgi:hypothetical protein
MNPIQYRKDLIKLVRENSRRHHVHRVWSDFVELAALSISNSMDFRERAAREERYQQIVKAYEPDEIKAFPKMLATLVLALEAAPGDVLGEVFGELELGNSNRGQVFTPYSLCKLMARLNFGKDALKQIIAERGFVSVHEPAAGAGALIIALAEHFQEFGINYQQHLHVCAWDVDPRAAQMAYVQFSLLHIPAIVTNGNTISMEVFETWRTPAHLMGWWENKLQRGYTLGSGMDDADPIFAEPARAPLPPSIALQQLDLFQTEGAA